MSSLLHSPLDGAALAALRECIVKAGRTPPDASMKCVEWHVSSKNWRVQLPNACGGGQHYFSQKQLGGCEAALIEAQHFRDDAHKKAGIDLHARIRVTRKRVQRGVILPICEGFDPRRNKAFVRGYWMQTIDGVSKQRVITRYVGRRKLSEAWEEVRAVVQREVSAEALRIKSGGIVS